MSPPADDGNEIEFLTPTTSQRRPPYADHQQQRGSLSIEIKDEHRSGLQGSLKQAADAEPDEPFDWASPLRDAPGAEESVRSAAGYSTGRARRPILLGLGLAVSLAAIVALALPGRDIVDDTEDTNFEVTEEIEQTEPTLDELDIGPDAIDLVPVVDDFEQQVRLVQPLTGLRDGLSGISPHSTGLSAVLVFNNRDAVLLDLDGGAVAEVPGYTHAILAASDTFLVTYGADGGSSVLVALEDWPLRSQRLDRDWAQIFLDGRRTDSVLALIDSQSASSNPDPGSTEAGGGNEAPDNRDSVNLDADSVQKVIRRVHLDPAIADIDYPVDEILWNQGTGIPIGTSPNGGIFELWADVENVSISERNANTEAYVHDYPASLFSNARFPAGSLRYVAPGSLLVADETRALVRDCDRTQAGCSLKWLDRSTWELTSVPVPAAVVTSWRIDGGGRWLVEDNVGSVNLIDLQSGRRLTLAVGFVEGSVTGPVRTFVSSNGLWLAYQDEADLVLVDLATSAQYRSKLPASTVLQGLVRTPPGFQPSEAAEPAPEAEHLTLSSSLFEPAGVPESLLGTGIVATGYLGATTVIDLGSGQSRSAGGLSELRIVQGNRAFGLTPNGDLGVLNLETGDLITRSLGTFKDLALWEGYLDGTMWVASTDQNRSLFDVTLVEQDSLEDRIFLTEAEIQFLPPVLPWDEDGLGDDGSGANRMAGSGRWRIVYDRGGRSYLVESETRNVVFVAEGGPKLGVDVSADGRWVVVSSNRGEITIADLDSAVYNGAGNAALEDLEQHKIVANQKISSIRFTQDLS